ncbi:MAG TPA: glycosyltransferase family 39 protein [Candidatus Eisenbacteria bacterium]|nr:glycosyltransferase family 39 protein [Candidatus Eisenbacteria bacterium]
MFKFIQNNFILYIFLVIFCVISVASIFRQSLGFDEIVDLQEGRNAVLYHTFDVDPYNTPLTREIGVLPYIFTKDFYKTQRYVLSHPVPGRIGITILGVLLLVTTYFFTKKFFGKSIASFATFLLTFEPTFLANGHLLTMDTGVALFFLLSIWVLVNYLKDQSKKNVVLLGIVVGLGCASKVSFIPYFALSAFAIALYKLFKEKQVLQLRLRSILLFFFVAGITVWSTYFFNWHVVIKERSDSNRVSEKITAYAQHHNMPFLTSIMTFGKTQPIPLGDFLATVKNNALRTSAHNCFFLGTYYNSCSWYFVFINFLLKIPIIFIVLLLVRIVTVHTLKNKNLFIIFLPIISIFLLAMSIDKVYPFVRYLFPVYPFLSVFAASSWDIWQRSLGTKILLAALCLWYVVSTSSTFPNFLSYANELAGMPSQRFLLLIDNNLDWGQTLPDVKHYVDVVKPRTILFSYFGRDNADVYGLQSDKPYGSYRNNEICEFHRVAMHNNKGKDIIIISASNWWFCGYYKQEQFSKNNIKQVVAQTILVFYK